MTKFEKTILNYLLDKYERSKSFNGDNKRGQTFSAKITKLYPKYSDETEYELYRNICETVSELESMGFVSVERKKNGVIDTVTLNISLLDEIYKYVSRIPKTEINNKLIKLLEMYSDNNELLTRYCSIQKKRLSQNKKPEYFDDDLSEYEMLLKAISMIFDVKEEIYIRDFSIRVFGDSKVFETMIGKVKRLLFQYGDFPDEENILDDLNIIKNPGHVYIKGSAVITISGQKIDLSELGGDIAVSSALLKNIDSISVTGRTVMTIENLTTFNAFEDNDTFAVYLGGYHNSYRRNFIMQIYHDNPDAVFYHFGDIDAGGFYILLHLKEKTGIRFKPYCMDITALRKYAQYTKTLTDNDKKRLRNLLNSEFSDTVKYMLEHNCKLEQEAMDQ